MDFITAFPLLIVLIVSPRSLNPVQNKLTSFLAPFTLTLPISPEYSSTTFTDATVYAEVLFQTATLTSLRIFGKHFEIHADKIKHFKLIPPTN
jgi:hypothetical protein